MDIFLVGAIAFLGYMVILALCCLAIFVLASQIANWWGINLMFRKLIAERNELRKELKRVTEGQDYGG